MDRVAEEDPRNEAGTGGAGSDVLELVRDLKDDPQALRDHILRQAAEISHLRTRNEHLESFRVLALDTAHAMARAAERAQSSP